MVISIIVKILKEYNISKQYDNLNEQINCYTNLDVCNKRGVRK